MSVTNMGAASALSSDQLAAASRAVSNELGKDAFLRLLIAQLSNQDPLNPMDDREFIAQMAQFSALEQMTNLNKTMEGMANLNQYSAVNYVGSLVAFDYTAPDGTVQQSAGTVVAVWYDGNNGPVLEVDEGYGPPTIMVPLNRIHGVTGGWWGA